MTSETQNNTNEDDPLKKTSVCPSTSTVNGNWSTDSTICCATTSKKLSHSSGDFDDGDSYCSGNCTCDSKNVHLSTYYEKPCSIADSDTLLHKSKWGIFKTKLLRKIKRIRKRYKNNKGKQESQIKVFESKDEVLVIDCLRRQTN